MSLMLFCVSGVLDRSVGSWTTWKWNPGPTIRILDHVFYQDMWKFHPGMVITNPDLIGNHHPRSRIYCSTCFCCVRQVESIL
jgi:hypothetical protein